MGTIDLSSGDPQTDAERAAWLLENGYQVVKSDSQESDYILEGVSGEAQDDEGEGQPRHPVTGQFITQGAAGELNKQKRGTTMATSNTAAGQIEELQKALDAETNPLRKAQIAEELTLSRLRNFHVARVAVKGDAQDALHGTDTPEVAGHLDTGASGVAGSVTAGTRTPASDSALHPGGQTTAEIPVESKVIDNPTAPVPDGAGIINPQALCGLEQQLAKATDPFERERLGDQVTYHRLRAFYAAKGLGQLGGSNNGGDLTTQQVVPTQRVDASDVGSVGRAVLPAYIAKARERKLRADIRAAMGKVTS
jgi:hypothetical protein